LVCGSGGALGRPRAGEREGGGQHRRALPVRRRPHPLQSRARPRPRRGLIGVSQAPVRKLPGATSYLLKTAPAEHVIAAIRDAAAGTASLSPELLTQLP